VLYFSCVRMDNCFPNTRLRRRPVQEKNWRRMERVYAVHAGTAWQFQAELRKVIVLLNPKHYKRICRPCLILAQTQTQTTTSQDTRDHHPRCLNPFWGSGLEARTASNVCRGRCPCLMALLKSIMHYRISF